MHVDVFSVAPLVSCLSSSRVWSCFRSSSSGIILFFYFFLLLILLLRCPPLLQCWFQLEPLSHTQCIMSLHSQVGRCMFRPTSFTVSCSLHSPSTIQQTNLTFVPHFFMNSTKCFRNHEKDTSVRFVVN